jgi:uncharacterized membrane protein YesL
MNKKLFDVIDKVYKLFMASLYFWGYAFKGLLVYGIFPSLCSLLIITKEILVDEDGDNVRGRYADYYNQHKHYGVWSMLIVFYFSALYAGLYFLNQSGTSLSKIISFVVLYMLFMGFMILSYISYFVAFQSMIIGLAFSRAFISTFKHLPISIATVALIYICTLIGSWNFIALIFIVPTLFAVGIRILMFNRI